MDHVRTNYSFYFCYPFCSSPSRECAIVGGRKKCVDTLSSPTFLFFCNRKKENRQTSSSFHLLLWSATTSLFSFPFTFVLVISCNKSMTGLLVQEVLPSSAWSTKQPKRELSHPWARHLASIAPLWGMNTCIKKCPRCALASNQIWVLSLLLIYFLHFLWFLIIEVYWI